MSTSAFTEFRLKVSQLLSAPNYILEDEQIQEGIRFLNARLDGLPNSEAQEENLNSLYSLGSQNRLQDSGSESQTSISEISPSLRLAKEQPNNASRRENHPHCSPYRDASSIGLLPRKHWESERWPRVFAREKAGQLNTAAKRLTKLREDVKKLTRKFRNLEQQMKQAESEREAGDPLLSDISNNSRLWVPYAHRENYWQYLLAVENRIVNRKENYRLEDVPSNLRSNFILSLRYGEAVDFLEAHQPGLGLLAGSLILNSAGSSLRDFAHSAAKDEIVLTLTRELFNGWPRYRRRYYEYKAGGRSFQVPTPRSCLEGCAENPVVSADEEDCQLCRTYTTLAPESADVTDLDPIVPNFTFEAAGQSHDVTSLDLVIPDFDSGAVHFHMDPDQSNNVTTLDLVIPEFVDSGGIVFGTNTDQAHFPYTDLGLFGPAFMATAANSRHSMHYPHGLLGLPEQSCTN